MYFIQYNNIKHIDYTKTEIKFSAFHIIRRPGGKRSIFHLRAPQTSTLIRSLQLLNIYHCIIIICIV